MRQSFIKLIIFQESKATPLLTNMSLYICSKTLKFFHGLVSFSLRNMIMHCHGHSKWQRVQKKGVLPRLSGPSFIDGLLVSCSSCRYKRFLFCLGFSSRPSTKYSSPHRTLFQFICPHRPASWASSRAGSPVF